MHKDEKQGMLNFLKPKGKTSFDSDWTEAFTNPDVNKQIKDSQGYKRWYKCIHSLFIDEISDENSHDYFNINRKDRCRYCLKKPCNGHGKYCQN